MIHNSVPGEPREDLYNLLDAREATGLRISVPAYRKVVDELYSNPNEGRLIVLCKDKSTELLVGIAIFKRQNIDADLVSPLPHSQVPVFAAARHQYWVLSYVVRRKDSRGKLIGHCCLCVGIEYIYSNFSGNRANISFWLQVAGSFRNTSALKLYLEYQFTIVAMYGGNSILMSLLDFEQDTLLRINTTLLRNLEARYLLPTLKKHLETPERNTVQDSQSSMMGQVIIYCNLLSSSST